VYPATSEVYSVLPGESLPFIWSDYRTAEKFPLVQLHSPQLGGCIINNSAVY
jgi:hypothetical protein